MERWAGLYVGIFLSLETLWNSYSYDNVGCLYVDYALGADAVSLFNSEWLVEFFIKDYVVIPRYVLSRKENFSRKLKHAESVQVT